MQAVLDDIRNGTFAKNWIAESNSGGKKYKEMLEKDMAHPIEEVGRKLRAKMSWLPKDSANKDGVAR